MQIKSADSIYGVIDIGTVYIIYEHWDDYSYCTRFNAYILNENSNEPELLGCLKIGTKDLSKKVKPERSINGYASYSVKCIIPNGLFINDDKLFFSLGQDLSYYKKINEFLGDESFEYYELINDLSFNFNLFKELFDNAEPCVVNSFMRNLHYSNIEQFNRIARGEAELTSYEFCFKYDKSEINIHVEPNSLPPTNIHVLIGRNGVGKTWLLHNIVNQLLNGNEFELDNQSSNKYSLSERFSIDCPINSFAGVIGLSFSVFDDAFCLDIHRKDTEQKHIDDFNKKYKYIGLIDTQQKNGKNKIKSIDDLTLEFMKALNRIKKSKPKSKLYLETCLNLNNDPMFYNNGFIKLLNLYLNEDLSYELLEDYCRKDDKKRDPEDVIKYNFKKLSSGHMIIILSLTLLSESIYEKTIILIDEPETHLHPPLLSTYIRTLSFLLIKKNAVAIIATHSPIVLQEVPKDCVYRVERKHSEMTFHNIKIESFATSTDSITREVFGLEVVKTGFYRLIEKELGTTFNETFNKFGGKIGFLGQVLMQSLVNKKGEVHEEDK